MSTVDTPLTTDRVAHGVLWTLGRIQRQGSCREVCISVIPYFARSPHRLREKNNFSFAVTVGGSGRSMNRSHIHLQFVSLMSFPSASCISLQLLGILLVNSKPKQGDTFVVVYNIPQNIHFQARNTRQSIESLNLSTCLGLLSVIDITLLFMIFHRIYIPKLQKHTPKR